MANAVRNRWIGLVFISMSISLVIIDGTIVNTIFPTIIKALTLTSTEVQWVQESYVLVFASLLLVWGSIADRIGRKRMLMIGILVFIASSAWAGLSVDANSLILARIVQGIGGSMVLPTTLALVNASFQGKERGIAFAIWGSTIGGMVALGPVLGGWLAGYENLLGLEGWRWAFMVNLPIGLIVVAGLWWWVTESKTQNFGGIDLVGALLSVLTFLTLVFGLIEGRAYGWWNINPKNQFALGDFKWPTEGISVIPVSLALAAVFATLFAIWARSRDKANKSVLLDLNLFRISSFRNGSIAVTIISLGEFGILFALPLWLQNVEGLSPLSSGLVILWLAGGAFLASGVAGALNGKLTAAAAVRIGVGLELAGVVGIAIVAQAGAGWAVVAPFLFLYGIGIGLATAQLTGVILADIPMNKIGQASGSQSTVRQIGSALGIAVLGTVLFAATQSSLDAKLTDLGVTGTTQSEISNLVVDTAGGIIPGLEAYSTQKLQQSPETAKAIVTAAGEAFTDGAKWSAGAAAIFLLLGFGATFRLGSRKPEESEVKA